MNSISASRILTLIAILCFVLAAIGVSVGSISLIAAGLAFWAAGTLVG